MGVVAHTLKKAAGWYLKSWLFLLWSALCFSAGAFAGMSALYMSVVAVLKSHGIDVL